MIFFNILLFILAKELAGALIPYKHEVSTTAKSEVKSEIIVERLRRLSNNSKVDNNLIFSDPELPTLPEALKNTNSDCIFWQYIHAKPLAVETVREQINELCVENSTETNNGWCEIALNLVVKQFGSNTIKSINLDEELIEKIDFKFYIHFTKSGLWQVVGMPNCDNEEETKKRVVRSIFQ